MCFEYPTILASEYDIPIFIPSRGKGGEIKMSKASGCYSCAIKFNCFNDIFVYKYKSLKEIFLKQ